MATRIFKTFSNGIRDVKTGLFYPFHVKSFFAPGVLLPDKPNIRYYIYRITLLGSSLGTDVGTSMSVTGIQDNETVTLAAVLKTTSVAERLSVGQSVLCLLDKESPVILTASDISTAGAVVAYAEVDESG